MTKRSTAVNRGWRDEAVVIAQNEHEKIYYIPSKRSLFASDGAGIVLLSTAMIPSYIQRNGMEQVVPVPTWAEMTERYLEEKRKIREERAKAVVA